MRPTLITIPISHYGERARWALDHAGIDYDEVHHVQMFSWISAWRCGRQKTLPVLVTETGPIGDSRDVVEWASARATRTLYPEAHRRAIDDLERELADPYGVEGRRIAYGWFFRSLDVCLPYNAGRAPSHEVRMVDAGRGPVRAFASWYLGVVPDKVDAGAGVVDRMMDRVAEMLRDGRPYLFGDTFTAADLTFAAMTAPNVAPEKYGSPLPPVDHLPDFARERVLACRAHPAGAFAMRLYDERPAPRGRFERPLRVPWYWEDKRDGAERNAPAGSDGARAATISQPG